MTEPVSSSLIEMRRLHPLSMVFELASVIRSNILPTAAAIFGTSRGGWIGLSIGVAALAFCFAIALFRYITFRYTIANNELIVDQGLINKVHRVVPLHRIQNIDLSQNLFHRLLRVGEVRVETASGKEPEAIMRVVALSEFARLKEERHASSYADLFANRVANSIDWESASNTNEAAVGLQANCDSASLQTKADNTRLVLALPLRLTVLGGLLSNRGEVIAGLALGFLFELRFGNSWFRSDSIGKFHIASKSDSAQAITTDTTAARGLIEMVRASYGTLGWLLLLCIGLVALFAILRVFSAIWYLLRFYGYRLESNGESLHVRCGLLTQVSATIPLGRVQLISVHRSWLQRRFGLASIRIETAGGGESKSENAASSVGRKWFVPILDAESIGNVLAAIDPRARFEEKSVTWQNLSENALPRMLRPVFLVSLLIVCLGMYFRLSWGWIPGVVIGVAGVMYVRKKSKSKRYARTVWGLIFKSGTWTQKCSMTFFEKIQGVSYTQTPFDRNWNMAGLSIDTASAGPANHRIQVGYLASEFAAREFEAIQSKIEIEST